MLFFPQMGTAHSRDGGYYPRRGGRVTLGRIWLDSKAYREGVERKELCESAFVFGLTKQDIGCDRRNGRKNREVHTSGLGTISPVHRR